MSELFPSAGKLSRGYDKDMVFQFFGDAREAYEGGATADQISFDEIRRAAFPLVRGGYDTRSVDRSLSRLESAFIQRDRANYITRNGEAAWYAKIADDATVLYPRLLRPHGDRFSHPEGRGYDAQEVDQLLDGLADYFDNNSGIKESDLRFAVFKSAKGDKAYVESQVDAFLARAMYVLLAVS